MNEVRLTQYSHGAGCGCKISPAILDQILKNQNGHHEIPELLVGNAARDDAAVIDIGNGECIISTTDFFMPIVDDPFDFGRIASVNAISDVYAMGGSPIMAIGILGWPVNELSPDIAGRVLEGAQKVCKEAGIPLAGGHSIDSPEPIFGLAVTGRVNVKNLKKNSGARVGDYLFLTKGLGVGILTTAEKKGLLRPEHRSIARDSMVRLNSIGEAFGRMDEVHAMTDVTGFGLLGHLNEICQASGVSARINAEHVPLLHSCVQDYILQGAIPGGSRRNFASYGDRVSVEVVNLKVDNLVDLLCDPQTSGGLLVAVERSGVDKFSTICAHKGLEMNPIGEIIPKGEFNILVN